MNITVTFNQPVYGVPVAAKHKYLMRCDCGDEDTAHSKKNIMFSARDHMLWHDGQATITDNARRNR